MNWDIFWLIVNTFIPILLGISVVVVVGIVAVFVIGVPIDLIVNWFNRSKKERGKEISKYE